MEASKVMPVFGVSPVIWHIGGVGSIGPAQAILDICPQARLITFDARKTDDRMACFSDRIGTATLHVNANPLSSSLLEPVAQDEQTVWEIDGVVRNQKWHEATKLVTVEEVATTTVDEMAKTEPQPDVLSLDVQGVEWDVMQGARATMPNVLCVVTECEFHPIYKGQALYQDQAALLHAHGFRLADIKGLEYWHPGEPAGQGFMTVGEAIWLRWDIENLNADQICKLAVIAFAFHLHSYAQLLTRKALEASTREAA